MIEWNKRLYHDKSIRTKHKSSKFNQNQLVLFGKNEAEKHIKIKPFAKKIIIALENGEAKYINTKGKLIYIYKL